MTTHRFDRSPTDPDLLEARVAARLVAALGDPASPLPDGVAVRLAFARRTALSRVRRAAGASALVAGGGTVTLGRLGVWWQRLGVALPAAVLAAGVVFVVDLRQREQVAVATEIDVALLADDLPPAAYADPGFVAFLKLQQP